MQIIELDLQDNTIIKCPFCGTSLYDDKGLHQCCHLLFHASDFGAEFVRDDFQNKFRNNLNINVDSDCEDEMTFMDQIKKISIPNAFCFALVNHSSPAMCGAGFTSLIGLCQYP